MLVLSGAAALLHESAWFRLLVPVLGAGTLPAAVVAAGALLGIGAGSWWGGRWSDAAARPLLVLAAAELGAAVTGLLVPSVLASVGGSGASLPLAAAVLALAAVPWGVTIPAAVRALAPDRGEVARVFKRAYAWNTGGAVLGLLLGAAWAFEALGNRGAVGVAAALEALVGLGVLAGAAVAAPLGARAVRRTRQPRHALHAPVVAAALAGAAGVGLQVAWMRRLTPLLGATYPVFVAVLVVHLAGIA